MAYDDRNTLGTAGSTVGTAGSSTVTGTGSVAATASGNPRGNVERRVLAASTIAGDRVRNRTGEDLGKIEEIMLDLQSGRVAYAVLSFGGFLGIGDKLFAVPWESLELNHEEHEFLLDVDKQTLENAPGFDKDNWPDMADTSWGSQVHSHYGQEPYWQRDANLANRSFGDRDEVDTDLNRTFSAGSGTERGNY